VSVDPVREVHDHATPSQESAHFLDRFPGMPDVTGCGTVPTRAPCGCSAAGPVPGSILFRRLAMWTRSVCVSSAYSSPLTRVSSWLWASTRATSDFRAILRGQAITCPNPATTEGGRSHAADKALMELVDVLLTALLDADWQHRQSLLDELAALGEAAVPRLADVARGPDEKRAIRALEALGRIGAPAVPTLADLVDRLPDDRYWRAADALATVRHVSAVKPLCELLAWDPAPHTRKQAAWALGEIGHPSALPALLRRRRLFGERIFTVEMSIIEAISKIQAREAAQPIRKMPIPAEPPAATGLPRTSRAPDPQPVDLPRPSEPGP
jgi:hypothetical protein